MGYTCHKVPRPEEYVTNTSRLYISGHDACTYTMAQVGQFEVAFMIFSGDPCSLHSLHALDALRPRSLHGTTFARPKIEFNTDHLVCKYLLFTNWVLPSQ